MSEEQIDDIDFIEEEEVSENTFFEPLFYFALIIIGLVCIKFIETLYLIATEHGGLH